MAFKLMLKPEEIKIVKDILQKYIPNKKVYAFGSRVNGNVKEFSDLDLVIVDQNILDISLFVALKNAFDESNLVIKVDIIEWVNLSTSFKDIILKKYYVLQN
jgi:predicted nucleotidyltransferase